MIAVDTVIMDCIIFLCLLLGERDLGLGHQGPPGLLFGHQGKETRSETPVRGS